MCILMRKNGKEVEGGGEENILEGGKWTRGGREGVRGRWELVRTVHRE